MTAPGATADAPGIGEELPAVVLVTASWCGPCAPASTVLTELSRRWSGRARSLEIADPADAALDALGVGVLPTWLLLASAVEGDGSAMRFPAGQDHGTDDSVVPPGVARDGARAVQGPLRNLRGRDPSDLSAGPESAGAPRPSVLEGDWVEIARLEGAQPKHRVAELLERLGDGSSGTVNFMSS